MTADRWTHHDPAVRKLIREAQAEAWDEGYDTGYDDCIFDDRGLSTDSDAHEYPHDNPYREAAR